MCFSWFDNKTRKPVIDTILETLDIEQEALYLTDHRKCYDGCKADYFTEKELSFIQENTNLIITFGKKAKNFFQEKPSTCITGDVSLKDNIREVHGHLFLLEDLGIYFMPLLFINIAQQAAPRRSYYNYMEDGLETYQRQT